MKPTTAAKLSLFAGLGIFLLKGLAWYLTGSVALLSDALESTVNVVAAAAALAALTVAARPADANHTFGHSKAEYLSAVFEGVLVAAAAVAIVHQAVLRLGSPRVLSDLGNDLGWGLGISAATAVLNGCLAAYLLRLGRARRSPALVADGAHIATDVVTTAGVLLGIGLAWLTGWWILDPLLALAVAAHVLWTGTRLVRDSVGGLMDEALPEDELQGLKEVLARQREGVLEIHDIKTRRSGRFPFVQFHLVVSGEMSVDRAHDLCDGLEEELRSVLPEAQVLIHVEPDSEVEHRGIRFSHHGERRNGGTGRHREEENREGAHRDEPNREEPA